MPDFSFTGKKILVISPQPWKNHLVSKQHYSKELAEKNDVYFISSPEPSAGLRYKCIDKGKVKSIEYHLPLPDFFRFHLKGLYRFVNRLYVKHIIAKLIKQVDVCIDFGAYLLYDDQSIANANTRIFFPVDDFENLQPNKRGADYLFSVSTNIVDKFKAAGIQCTLINHGLSVDFCKTAALKLEGNLNWTPPAKIKVAYSGNLFIPFLNTDIFTEIIEKHPEIEFHLFGQDKYDGSEERFLQWNHFIHSTPNVILHGFVSTVQLADHLETMDAFLICYEPDFKNYHGENSHKILEYMVTGKVTVSTFISYYADSDLLNMSPFKESKKLPAVFSETIANLSKYNSKELAAKRIGFAIDNSYVKQIERVEAVIAGGYKK